MTGIGLDPRRPRLDQEGAGWIRGITAGAATAPTRGASTEPGRLVDVPPSAQRAELAECDIVAGELPDPGPGVFQPPHSTDAPIIDSDEGDFVDVHAPTGGCDALPLGRLGARAAKVRDDSVAFLDELDDLLVPVGEAARNCSKAVRSLGASWSVASSSSTSKRRALMTSSTSRCTSRLLKLVVAVPDGGPLTELPSFELTPEPR